MSHALRAFGYNVSDRFVRILIQTFDKYGQCVTFFIIEKLKFTYVKISGTGDITFDNFVQACVTLSTLTNSFRARDNESKGSIIIQYEDVSVLFRIKRSNSDIKKSLMIYFIIYSSS